MTNLSQKLFSTLSHRLNGFTLGTAGAAAAGAGQGGMSFNVLGGDLVGDTMLTCLVLELTRSEVILRESDALRGEIFFNEEGFVADADDEVGVLEGVDGDS